VLSLTFKEVQKRLMAFDEQRGWDKSSSPELHFNRLISEVGELSDAIFGIWFETSENRSSSVSFKEAREKAISMAKDRVAEEIADSMIYLLKIRNSLNIDIGEAIAHKMKKNEERDWGKFNKKIQAAPSE
jgi:NTP pyrophosphatase (non-canonical NTP hydrolase)